MNDEEQKIPFITELNDSDTLVIAILGNGNKLGISVKRFFRKSGLKDASKIIIWDSSKQNTLGGLSPDFATFNDLLGHLKTIVSTHPHKKLYITGNSGGGHSALLFGHLLKADKVVAFAPYPYLSLKTGAERNDSVSKLAEKLDKLPNDVKQYFDLADVLVDWNGKTEYFVHVSADYPTDFTRVQYLQGLPKVEIVSHPYEIHGVCRKLANDKALDNCFKFPYQQQIVQSSSEKP